MLIRPGGDHIFNNLKGVGESKSKLFGKVK